MPAQLAKDVPLIAEFIAACHALCMDLLEGMALSLSLPKDYFTSRHLPDAPAGTALRLLYYPATSTGEEPLVRAGAHSDYGSLTLLFQQEGADASGLQVLLPQRQGEKSQQGEWLDVPASPERVLVNIADLMESLDSRSLAINSAPGARPTSHVHRSKAVNSILPPSGGRRPLAQDRRLGGQRRGTGEGEEVCGGD
ncbi:Clavaminate synthase-like protein, partial [Calocera viscosa TUFC12733]